MIWEYIYRIWISRKGVGIVSTTIVTIGENTVMTIQPIAH